MLAFFLGDPPPAPPLPQMPWRVQSAMIAWTLCVCVSVCLSVCLSVCVCLSASVCVNACAGVSFNFLSGLILSPQMPWRVQSAMIASVYHHLLTHDANVRAKVASYLPFLADVDTVYEYTNIRYTTILYYANARRKRQRQGRVLPPLPRRRRYGSPAYTMLD